jgi:hypothetical protein
MTPTGSLRYRLISTNWQNGLLTIRQIELFVKTNWLTREQADEIYKLPRKQTDLVLDDPLTDDTIETTRLEVNR